MNDFPFVSTSPARRAKRRLPAAVAILMVALASAAVIPLPAAAQMEYDFNGDSKVTCTDFEVQYPDTFTDEATKALQKYPNDPSISRLDGSTGVKGIACEGQSTSAVTDANTASRPPKPAPTARNPASQTREPVPVPAIPVTGPAATSDVPADVMARVAGCAVIAISARDVAGAGCPGVGSIAFRIPDDAQSMNGTVIMTPKAPPAAETGGPQKATVATGATGSAKKDAATTNGGKKTKKAAANSAGSSKNKGKGKSKGKGKGKTQKSSGKQKKKGGKTSQKQQRA